MSGPGQENEVSKGTKEMEFPSQYDNVDYGKKTKLVKRKISHTEKGGEGKFYGSRTIVTKEGKETFIDFLLTEKRDITLLPDIVLDQLRKLIRDGAKDVTQDWKHALHLVNTAYHVAQVRRPVPDEKGAWKQYEELISFAVKQLSKTRGLDGKWRTSTVLVREGEEQLDEFEMPKPRKPSLQSFAQRSDNDIGKRRFFIEIPGQSAAEIDAKNIDEIIVMMTNKLRRHGTRLHVEEKTKTYAICSVWVQDVKRDEIVIKEVS